MTTFHSSLPRTSFPGLRRLAEEVTVMLDALLHPARLVAQVEEMRRLQLLADRVEATDPARAAVLRQRAARILN